MKKSEAEPILRGLINDWARETGVRVKKDDPSFSAFTSWLSRKGYSHYMRFDSYTGASFDVEMWFDQELNQTWRR